MPYADGLEHEHNPGEYAEGKKAFHGGCKSSDNPYDCLGDQYWAWEQGWMDAFGEDVHKEDDE